jgi:ferritin-like metal-binding protein YciE
MSDRNDTLQQYVSDMLALERHIHDAVRRQRDDDKVASHPKVHSLISRMESTLDEHIEHLERHLKAIGGDSSSPVKEAVSAVAGMAAGLYDKVRTDKVSKMLRDDYTALGLAAISYTMLHTTGLALASEETANIALRHLRHWTPMIVDISEVIPLVVAKELAEDPGQVSPMVGEQAVRNTQSAWSREATQQMA